MLSLYEILKASKTGIAPDMWTALAGANFGGAGSGAEVKELTGIPPLSFRADVSPLLDFLISGNMSQTGTPTPDNPIMPEGCGERTGNLFDKNATNTNNGYISNGYLQSVGSISTNITYRVSEYIRISQNQPYILYYGANLNSPSVCFYDSEKNYISGVPYSGRWDVSFTTPQNAEYLRLSFRAADVGIIKLNEGSHPLPYEPYGVKIPISSASTTTPVYLGEVQTTRKIKKLVLDGTEGWEKYSSTADSYLYYLTGLSRSDVSDCICTHTPYSSTIPNGSDAGVRISNSRTVLLLNCGSTTIQNNTKEDFKTWLAQQYANGTPVCVWYVLATPETGIINEPIRKIGEYADSISMEQAGISIPTNNGSTTVDVETTLKPSEVYIKYKGV